MSAARGRARSRCPHSAIPGARYTYCIAENEEASPWAPYHTGRGFPATASTVTLFAGEAPHGISDHSSRTARALGGSLGWSMAGLWNSKHFPLYSHTMLVVGPEHARTLADDGWSKEDLKRHLRDGASPVSGTAARQRTTARARICGSGRPDRGPSPRP